MRAIGAIDLVDRQDHGQIATERLAQHEPGLWQRSLGGVDEQHDAVDHREGSLHLTAEVGVAGRVDDVERHAVPHQGRVLGEDGDALLAFEIHRVEHPLGHFLVGAEDAGLLQQRVDQGGLPMIDVGDDRQVAQVGAFGHDTSTLTESALRSPESRPAQRPKAAAEASDHAGTRRSILNSSVALSPRKRRRSESLPKSAASSSRSVRY